MNRLITEIWSRSNSEAGQTLSEFSLILAFVAAVSVAALTALGLIIAVPFSDVTAGF